MKTSSGHYKSVALHGLKEVVGRHHAGFHGSEQQDAHEFLMYLLDSLHDEPNKVHHKRSLQEHENDVEPETSELSNGSFIQDLIWGQHRSTLDCSRCGYKSTKFETFSHLSVPVPAKSECGSLHGCIELYMAGDTITGWTCPKCKNSTDATKKTDIWHLPPVLIIHLQRFYSDGLLRKNNSDVKFPLDNLDMSPYIINEEAQYRHHKYRLYGAVNHVGSMERGHYTASCYCANSDRWHMFNDQEVHRLDIDAVQSPASCILFYSAIDGRA